MGNCFPKPKTKPNQVVPLPRRTLDTIMAGVNLLDDGTMSTKIMGKDIQDRFKDLSFVLESMCTASPWMKGLQETFSSISPIIELIAHVSIPPPGGQVLAAVFKLTATLANGAIHDRNCMNLVLRCQTLLVSVKGLYEKVVVESDWNMDLHAKLEGFHKTCKNVEGYVEQQLSKASGLRWLLLGGSGGSRYAELLQDVNSSWEMLMDIVSLDTHEKMTALPAKIEAMMMELARNLTAIVAKKDGKEDATGVEAGVEPDLPLPGVVLTTPQKVTRIKLPPVSPVSPLSPVTPDRAKSNSDDLISGLKLDEMRFLLKATFEITGESYRSWEGKLKNDNEPGNGVLSPDGKKINKPGYKKELQDLWKDGDITFLAQLIAQVKERTERLDIMTGLLKADKERLLKELRPHVYKPGMKVGDLDEALTDSHEIEEEKLVSLCESLRPADLLFRCDQLKNATQLKAMEKELRKKYPHWGIRVFASTRKDEFESKRSELRDIIERNYPVQNLEDAMNQAG